jgi:dipeptide/tripeptide permease
LTLPLPRNTSSKTIISLQLLHLATGYGREIWGQVWEWTLVIYTNFCREFSLLGLALIAIGTGGIKPCVSAFGGDQFKLPEQERHLQTFFSVFYFSINAGSLIGTALTPYLREVRLLK